MKFIRPLLASSRVAAFPFAMAAFQVKDHMSFLEIMAHTLRLSVFLNKSPSIPWLTQLIATRPDETLLTSYIYLHKHDRFASNMSSQSVESIQALDSYVRLPSSHPMALLPKLCFPLSSSTSTCTTFHTNQIKMKTSQSTDPSVIPS